MEESIDNKTIRVGPPEKVAEEIAFDRDPLGSSTSRCSRTRRDPYKKADEQMAPLRRRGPPTALITPPATTAQR